MRDHFITALIALAIISFVAWHVPPAVATERANEVNLRKKRCARVYVIGYCDNLSTTAKAGYGTYQYKGGKEPK